MQNLILPATQTDQRTRPTAQPLLALLVCFTEMAFMFPAFHTVRSSGLAADGLGAMTGPVIPGAARQDKKEKRNRNEDCKRTAHILHATSRESNMNEDNKSATPSETPRGSVSFVRSFSRRHPEPGAAREDKKEQKKQKRRLRTYGTVTARNARREQHESREHVYNVKSPVVLNYKRTPCYVMNSYAMQNSITNSSGLHKHGYPRCKIQSSPATQSHYKFCHAKSRIANT